jgi:hypothetical protein
MKQPDLDANDEQFLTMDPRHQTDMDREYSRAMERYFAQSLGSNMDKLRHFTKFVPRQALSLFLAKNAMFQHIVGIHGHVIECGVFLGSGLMTWAQLSAIYEPINHTRRIVGFDTFSGFPSIHGNDLTGAHLDYTTEGGLSTGARADVEEGLRLYDMNRPLGHISRTELVVGDATQTIPQYVEKNKHLLVAMLYLDFDIFEPSKVAIETFLPRMPKGSVIAFDELGQEYWPGETLALLETVGVRNVRLQRYPFTPALSYAVLE